MGATRGTISAKKTWIEYRKNMEKNVSFIQSCEVDSKKSGLKRKKNDKKDRQTIPFVVHFPKVTNDGGVKNSGQQHKTL